MQRPKRISKLTDKSKFDIIIVVGVAVATDIAATDVFRLWKFFGINFQSIFLYISLNHVYQFEKE